MPGKLFESLGPMPSRTTQPKEHAEWQKKWQDFKKSPEYAKYLTDRATRIADNRPETPKPTTEMLAMTVEQLNKLSDDLDRQRVELMVKKRQVAEARNRLLAEDHAAGHGLTVEQYDAMKAKARESGTDLVTALTAARKNVVRGVQVVRTQAASASAKGVK